jgi:hypothetical protein
LAPSRKHCPDQGRDRTPDRAKELSNLTEALRRLADWPEGTVHGTSGGRRYVVSKTCFAEGRSVKLVATELGGPDYISLNVYDLRRGPLLKPCEMPEQKVVAFLADLCA